MAKEKKKKSILGRVLFWAGLASYLLFALSPYIGFAFPIFLAPALMIGAVSMVGYETAKVGNKGRKKIGDINKKRKEKKANKAAEKAAKKEAEKNKDIPEKENKKSNLVLNQAVYEAAANKKDKKRGK